MFMAGMKAAVDRTVRLLLLRAAVATSNDPASGRHVRAGSDPDFVGRVLDVWDVETTAIIAASESNRREPRSARRHEPHIGSARSITTS